MDHHHPCAGPVLTRSKDWQRLHVRRRRNRAKGIEQFVFQVDFAAVRLENTTVAQQHPDAHKSRLFKHNGLVIQCGEQSRFEPHLPFGTPVDPEVKQRYAASLGACRRHGHNGSTPLARTSSIAIAAALLSTSGIWLFFGTSSSLA